MSEEQDKTVKTRVRQVSAVLLSIGLLVLDRVYAGLSRGVKWLLPLLPTGARLFGIGCLSGGVVVGLLYTAARAAVLVPGTDWLRIALVWGLALLMLAVDALAFMMLKSASTLFAGIVYRLTDITSRPVSYIDERPRIRPEGNDPPAFRDPGKMKDDKPRSSGGSSFIPYDEDEAYVQDAVTEMRAEKMSEENIAEVLKDFREQAQRGNRS